MFARRDLFSLPLLLAPPDAEQPLGFTAALCWCPSGLFVHTSHKQNVVFKMTNWSRMGNGAFGQEVAPTRTHQEGRKRRELGPLIHSEIRRAGGA